jgi:hypothetical protein
MPYGQNHKNKRKHISADCRSIKIKENTFLQIAEA